MVSTVIVSKKIPLSDWYSGGGVNQVTSVRIAADDVSIHTKKSLTKAKLSTSKKNQDLNPTDKSYGFVMDLRRVEDNINIRGIIADDDGESAWNKCWKVRAMCAVGNIGGDLGALHNLQIDNLNFSTSTQTAFLEDVMFKPINSRKDLAFSHKADDGIARFDIQCNFYLGDPK